MAKQWRTQGNIVFEGSEDKQAWMTLSGILTWWKVPSDKVDST